MTLGEKIKQLREQRNLSQRQVGVAVEVDAAFISKVERNEKQINRNHLKKLSELLKVHEDELQTLWLADKVYRVIEHEALGYAALKVAESKVHYKTT